MTGNNSSPETRSATSAASSPQCHPQRMTLGWAVRAQITWPPLQACLWHPPPTAAKHRLQKHEPAAERVQWTHAANASPEMTFSKDRNVIARLEQQQCGIAVQLHGASCLLLLVLCTAQTFRWTDACCSSGRKSSAGVVKEYSIGLRRFEGVGAACARTPLISTSTILPACCSCGRTHKQSWGALQ